MISLILAAAAASQAPTPASPSIAGETRLTAPQASALRCGVVFALGTKLQENKSPAAATWPPLGARGKEYFVQVTARLMDDTKASRETITAMAMREVQALKDPRAVGAALPACLPLLDASGL